MRVTTRRRACALGLGLSLFAAADKLPAQARALTFSGWLQMDGSSPLAGGLPHALGLDGQYLFDLSLTVDTHQLLGWPGGTVVIDVQSHAGPSILDRQMPAIQDPDNMDAHQETSVDRAWWQQVLHQRKLQLRAGLMYVDDQFLTVPYGQNFVSLNFSSDASISTFVLPTFPQGAWGADAVYTPLAGLYFSGGAWRDHSTELPYDPGGTLEMTEAGWGGRWRGLPYKLQVGAWHDTGRFRPFAGGAARQASGAYLVASQKLWHPRASRERGLGAFFQFGSAPEAVAPVRKHLGAGLVWTGPSASRPKDEIGVAFSDALLTRHHSFAQGFENEVEAYYQFDASHGWTIQPGLEYWRHPNGGTAPDTLLGLLRLQFSF